MSRNNLSNKKRANIPIILLLEVFDIIDNKTECSVYPTRTASPLFNQLEKFRRVSFGTLKERRENAPTVDEKVFSSFLTDILHEQKGQD